MKASARSDTKRRLAQIRANRMKDLEKRQTETANLSAYQALVEEAIKSGAVRVERLPPSQVKNPTRVRARY